MHLDSSAIAGYESDAYLYLQSGQNVNAQDVEGRTSLSQAAEHNHQAVVKRLLKQISIDPNSKDADGWTPLLRAAKRGRINVVKLLLEQDGINPNCRDNNSRTPLSWAAERGHQSVVELLLIDNSVDLESKDNDGRTPLSWAAEHGYQEVVKLLLEQDSIDPDPKDNNSWTPLSWAAKLGHQDVVKLLLKKDGVNPNFKDKDGRMPLSQAAENGHEEVINLLLKKDSINPDLKDNNGQTPLSWAAKRGCEKAVKRLLWQDGVNPDSTDNKDRTPLWWAAEGGHKVVVKLLLAKHGVDPDPTDDDGQTPLSRAAENGHQKTASLLLPRDTITLHVQVQKGNLPLVMLLLKAKYNVNTRDTLSRTPLHIAILFGHFDITRELICSQANINSEDVNGTTPLRLALQQKYEDIIQLLLEYSVQTTGIMSAEWLNAYKQKAFDVILELSQTSGGKKSVRFINDMRVRLPVEPCLVRRLLLFADYSTWSNCLNFDPRDALQSDRSHLFSKVQIHDKCVSLFVAGYFPIGQGLGDQKRFAVSDWGKCGIAWTIISPTKPKDGLCWRSMDHFSTLSYGWIPDNGADFFTLFIQTMKEKWLTLCGLAEEHLSRRRLDQLCAKGDSPTLIHRLAEDAQEWAKLRSILRDQVREARNFAVEYCKYYDQDNGSRVMQEAIDCFKAEVNDQISQLEQTVKDLLQFEFAWVSINEAHRSTSIATSIKRLSWITFIFLPAMFASSLFGMNVNILETNPDWRWYILFGGGSLILTVLGWLLFKYGQIERLVEQHIGTRLQRWSESVARYAQRSKASQQSLPTSE